MDKKTIVIIGGVAGGATAAAKLRRLNEKDEIIIFEKDEYVSFANCGLPYYIGNVITDRSKLLVQTVDGLSTRFNLDIRTKSEVVRIDKETKTVFAINEHKEMISQKYDVLILSPGASPIVPPLPGLREATNVFTLRNIPHTDAIMNFLVQQKPQHATIIGGGFIGVEMAENLHRRGLQVTIIDMANQILAPIDFEMAQFVHEECIKKGIHLLLNDGVKRISEEGRIVETQSGIQVPSDIIILAIGVNSEIRLAKEAGLAIGQLNGILVDDTLKTSDPYIYALGDAIEVKSRVAKHQTKIPLAWPANRQGIVVANAINGVNDTYLGSYGTAVAKVFDLTVASTGLNEKQCQALNIPYQVVHVTRNNHASYYPGATSIVLKLVFSPEDGTIYGAQAVGREGTEKRIDIIVTAMAGNLKVTDLMNLELAYAPPYSSAKDPVNIAGYVATHIFKKEYATIQWHQVDDLVRNGSVLIDVRTPVEFELGHIPGSLNIELDTLRTQLHNLPSKSTPIIITCQVGHRGYLALRILQEHGFTNVVNLDGGYRLFAITQVNHSSPTILTAVDVSSSADEQVVAIPAKPSVIIDVDACGLQCPGPILETYKTMEKMEAHQILRIKSSDFGFYTDIVKWAEKTGNKVLEVKIENNIVIATIEKGAIKPSHTSKSNENTTIVLFSSDLDKALAAMVIANGAAAMGKKVSVFASFWGLNFLRKTDVVHVKKNFIEHMFGIMMPKGANKLSLSKMNMGGLGKHMMVNVMKQKNVDSLPSMLAQAQANGVNFIACTMSMDVMGIKKEELIDGVTFGGVATYLAESENAGLTLFI